MIAQPVEVHGETHESHAKKTTKDSPGNPITRLTTRAAALGGDDADELFDHKIGNLTEKQDR